MRRSVWERCMRDGRAFTRQFQYVLSPADLPGRFQFWYRCSGAFIVRKPIGVDSWDTADSMIVWAQNPLDPDSHIGL